jgi:hypothetical protein
LLCDAEVSAIRPTLVTKPAPALDYSTEPHPRWWVRYRRLIIALASTLVVAVPIYHYRQPLLRRGTELYWSRQCSRFTAAAETPLVANAQTIGDNNYAAVDPSYMSGQQSSTLFFQPRCWRELAKLTGAQPYHFGPHATIFLHELRSPSGKRRIVHVECLNANMRTLPYYLLPTIIEPATFTSPPRIIFDSRGGLAIGGLQVFGQFSFGQVDRNNRSHFTLEARAINPDPRLSQPLQKVIIDGYLNDNDQITFRTRAGLMSREITVPSTTPSRG